MLVQDYHFALLPRMIRERLPDAIIITFWHIPWPNSEVFSVCPWREQILEGLLGSSIIGFHIQLHCNNFIESVDRFLESRIDREDAAISYGGETTLVHSYPISIEWPEPPLGRQPRWRNACPVANDTVCRRTSSCCVGVERLDYTKGILDRFHALGRVLPPASRMDRQAGVPAGGGAQPEHFAGLPAASPGMPRLSSTTINERYGREGYQPIILLDEHQTAGAALRGLSRRRRLRGQQPA